MRRLMFAALLLVAAVGVGYSSHDAPEPDATAMGDPIDLADGPCWDLDTLEQAAPSVCAEPARFLSTAEIETAGEWCGSKSSLYASAPRCAARKSEEPAAYS